MQSKQRVEKQSLKDLSDLLNSYIQAKAIITGVAGAKFYAAEFVGGH